MIPAIRYFVLLFGLLTIVYGLPALVFLYMFKMPVFQSLLFGFLTGSLIIGALEMLGLFSKGIKSLAKKNNPKQ